MNLSYEALHRGAELDEPRYSCRFPRSILPGRQRRGMAAVSILTIIDSPLRITRRNRDRKSSLVDPDKDQCGRPVRAGSRRRSPYAGPPLNIPPSPRTHTGPSITRNSHPSKAICLFHPKRRPPFPGRCPFLLPKRPGGARERIDNDCKSAITARCVRHVDPPSWPTQASPLNLNVSSH
jgi:hypothetical protein